MTRVRMGPFHSPVEAGVSSVLRVAGINLTSRDTGDISQRFSAGPVIYRDDT